MMSGEYQHRTYRMARAYIQEPDGTVREATPAELTDLGARVAKAMAKAMLRSVPAQSPNSQAAKRGESRQCSAPAMDVIAFAELVHGKPLTWWQRELLEAVARGDHVRLIERPRLSTRQILEASRAVCAAAEAKQQ